MNSRFFFAVALGSVVLLPVGFLLYGVLFAFLFEQGAINLPGVMRTSPSILWIIVGQIGFGTLLTLVISWRGATSLWGGAQTGAILGSLMAVGYDFAQFGTSHLWSLSATLIDPFISGALVACSGAAIGFVLRPGLAGASTVPSQ